MRSITVFIFLVAAALASQPAFAVATAETPAAPERKLPSSAARPKKQTPAAQLAYANSLRDTGKTRDAARQYDALVRKWGDSAEAPVAQLEYARLLEKKGDYSDAFDEFEYLIRFYTSGFEYSDVLDSEFRIANCIMTARRRFSNSAGFSAALPLFEKIALNGPQWSGTPQAQFNIGWIHENLGEYDLAAAAYETVQQNYSTSKSAADAAFRQGYCLYRTARRDRPNEERSFQLVRTQLQKFLRAYPAHESADEAASCLSEVVKKLADMAYQRAVFYDKGGYLQAALIAYKDFVIKFPGSEKEEIARKRMGKLKKIVSPGEAAAEADAEALTEREKPSVHPETTATGEEKQ